MANASMASPVQLLSSRQQLASVRRLLDPTLARPGGGWVVVLRERGAAEPSELFAWRLQAFLDLPALREGNPLSPLDELLDLDRQTSSPVLDRWRLPAAGFVQGLSPCCVLVDAMQRPVDVMERTQPPTAQRRSPTRESAPASGSAWGLEGLARLGLPRLRGEGQTRRPPAADADVFTGGAAADVPAPKPPAVPARDFVAPLWLQAKAPQSLLPRGEDIVEVFLARRGPVLPGIPGLVVPASSAQPMTVLLSVLGDAVEVTGPRLLRMPVPQGDRPEVGAFEIRGVRPGQAELAVVFRQEGRELGQLRLWVRVGAPALPRVTTEMAAAPSSAAADAGEPPVLWLDVEPVLSGAERRYRYRVTSAALGLDHAEFMSAPLLDRGGGAAASELDFLQQLYGRLSNKVLRTDVQAQLFDHELRATAEELCVQLLPAELRQLLWRERDRIGIIRVMSWEPHVPWELLRLHDPGRPGEEDRFLGEHGLVRWLSGRAAVPSLPLAQWSYLAATYPNNPADDVVRQVDYFTQQLPRHQITPTRIPATLDALVEALGNPGYDVLHLACHGEADADQIDDATLYITDELARGRVVPVGLSARVLGSLARLESRRPLVFLNACSSGRTGLSLTAWGGWPRRLIDRGAGAVVGASWPVRDGSSNAFACAFYDALLQGHTLAAAAQAARQASMASGDATWLAFKVFGDPHARRAVP